MLKWFTHHSGGSNVGESGTGLKAGVMHVELSKARLLTGCCLQGARQVVNLALKDNARCESSSKLTQLDFDACQTNSVVDYTGVLSKQSPLCSVIIPKLVDLVGRLGEGVKTHLPTVTTG